MRCMFTISAHGCDANKAAELKEKMEALMESYGMKGKTNGHAHEQYANYCGSYCKEDKDNHGGKPWQGGNNWQGGHNWQGGNTWQGSKPWQGGKGYGGVKQREDDKAEA
ncbi:MAG: hypothetical protein N3B21_08780 [Clostridia bacterium]|nr:hypothetical protein [Clostridia bacterium]